MERFLSDGVEIAYVVAGEGPPVLLIHGFGSNHAVNWQATGWTGKLHEAGRQTIAMDVRGHGHSGKLYDSAAYTPEVMAQDAARLLEHLGMPRADIMGYSMGGRIAATLAINDPGRVNSLVIGGMGDALVNGIGGEEEIVAALEAPSLEDVTDRGGLAYRKFAEQTRSDRHALAACIIGQRTAIPAADVARIQAPTLVAVGEKDAVAGSAEGLAKIIPNAEVLIIPNRDHMLATGDRSFKAGVVSFLERHGLPQG